MLANKSFWTILFVLFAGLSLSVVVQSQTTTTTVCVCTCTDGGSSSTNSTSSTSSTTTPSCDETFQTGYQDESKCEEECGTQCPDVTVAASLVCREQSTDEEGPGADPYHDIEGDASGAAFHHHPTMGSSAVVAAALMVAALSLFSGV